MYCKQCGTLIDNPEIKKCPKCNTIVGRGGRFCPDCGKQIKNGKCDCGSQNTRSVSNNKNASPVKEQAPQTTVSTPKPQVKQEIPQIKNPLFARIAAMPNERATEIEEIKQKVATSIYNDMVESGEISPEVTPEPIEEKPQVKVEIPVISTSASTVKGKQQKNEPKNTEPKEKSNKVEDSQNKDSVKTVAQVSASKESVSVQITEKAPEKPQNMGFNIFNTDNHSGGNFVPQGNNVLPKSQDASDKTEEVNNSVVIPTVSEKNDIEKAKGVFKRPTPNTGIDIAVLARQASDDNSNDITPKKNGRYIKIPEKASLDCFWILGALLCIYGMLGAIIPYFSFFSLGYKVSLYVVYGFAAACGLMDVFINRKRTGYGVIIFAAIQIISTLI